MTGAIKPHDSLSLTTLWYHTSGSHNKEEKKNTKVSTSCSGLPVTLNLGRNHSQLCPQFLRAGLPLLLRPYLVRGLYSESLLPAFLSGKPGSSQTTLSWCIVKSNVTKA